MEKRKPRNKMSKTIDIVKPLTLDIIGSKDDPCFGKLYNPQTEECSSCGDSEICAIVMSQMNNLTRAEVEAKGHFKDLEETQIVPLDKKAIRKKIKTRIREVVKLSGKKGVTRERLIADIHATFVTQGFTKKRIGKIIDALTEVTDRFTYSSKNNTYKWKMPT